MMEVCGRYTSAILVENDTFKCAYPEIDLAALEPVHVDTIHAAVAVLCSI